MGTWHICACHDSIFEPYLDSTLLLLCLILASYSPIDVAAAEGLPQSALPLLQRYLSLLRGDVRFAVLALCPAQE